MLVKYVLLHEVSTLEPFTAHIALENLSFCHFRCLSLSILVLPKLEDSVFLRRDKLSRSKFNPALSSFHILLFEALAVILLRATVNVISWNPFGISDMLWTTLCGKHPLIIVFFPAVEAVGMDSSEVDQQQIQLLFLAEEL